MSMSDQPNEILEAAAAAKAQQDAAAKASAATKKNRWPMRIIGVGIGSAAVAAAVLYANSDKTKD
jgi:fructoselysine-6-P-deglycase FrlB-like protein